MWRLFVVLMLVFVLPASMVQAAPLSRTILVPLADSQSDPMYSQAHQAAEVILNYYGLKVEYVPLDADLPNVKDRSDVQGILSWLPSGVVLKKPDAYYGWLASAQDAGKKLVYMGEVFPLDAQGNPPTLKNINKVLNKIGVYADGLWVSDAYTYSEVTGTKGFETQLPQQPPSGFRVTPQSDNLTLIALYEHNSGENLPVIGAALSLHGGYAMNDFALMEVGEGDALERRWVINPFEFFGKAFDVIDRPKPDVTTMLGTRLYFSHIDGDGWRSNSQIERAKLQPKTNAEVLLTEVLQKTPDLPTTVAPIAAELDPKWSGTDETQRIVRKIFALPNVEPSSHTYSHPFSWDFYKPENFSQKLENQMAGLYPKCGSSVNSSVKHSHSQQTIGYGTNTAPDENLLTGYDIPRAFGCMPVTPEIETAEAAAYISQFAPTDKPVRLVQWSGNTRPFEEVLAATEAVNLTHINGGNTRFDNAFPSYAHVSPIGIHKGKYWQVYAPMSNENTYTNLWTGPFHGFQYLKQTLENTGAPYRLKPMNVYYHTYSAERDASLNSLLEVIEYVRQKKVLPIKASTFADIAQGFFAVEVSPKNGGWAVRNRGSLQTIRFDNATFKEVDFLRSIGVIGQRHLAGSLYVALNPQVGEPVVVLKDSDEIDQAPKAAQPYIIESRWPVDLMNVTQRSLYFETKGFGSGAIVFRFPEAKNTKVVIKQGDKVTTLALETTGSENLLTIPLDQLEAIGALTPTTVKVSW